MEDRQEMQASLVEKLSVIPMEDGEDTVEVLSLVKTLQKLIGLLLMLPDGLQRI